jgi:hypothetical protein
MVCLRELKIKGDAEAELLCCCWLPLDGHMVSIVRQSIVCINNSKIRAMVRIFCRDILSWPLPSPDVVCCSRSPSNLFLGHAFANLPKSIKKRLLVRLALTGMDHTWKPSVGANNCNFASDMRLKFLSVRVSHHDVFWAPKMVVVELCDMPNTTTLNKSLARPGSGPVDQISKSQPG